MQNLIKYIFIFIAFFLVNSCGDEGKVKDIIDFDEPVVIENLDYIYSSHSSVKPHFQADKDFSYGTWGTPTMLEGNYTSDSDYNPVWQVRGNGSSWGTVLAMDSFQAGFANSYQALKFKIKGVASITVKFAGGVEVEKTYNITSVGEEIEGTSGWYSVTVPMSDFTDKENNNAFAIFSYNNNDTFYLTDIGFAK